MNRNRVTSNRKSTKGRKIYYQEVTGKIKDVYDNRLVSVKNTWFWKLLCYLKLIKKSSLITRKNIKVGEVIGRLKTIKHLQPSPQSAEVSKKMIEAMDYKNRHISSRNPRTIMTWRERHRIALLWDSARKGTYIRKIHGELNK